MTEQQIQVVNTLAVFNNKIAQTDEKEILYGYIQEAYREAVIVQPVRFQSKRSALDDLERIAERIKVEEGAKNLSHSKFQTMMTLKILMNSFGEMK